MPSKNYTQDIVQKDKAHFMHPWTFFDVLSRPEMCLHI